MVTRRKGRREEAGEGQRGQTGGDEGDGHCMVKTQCLIQMMCHKTIHLKLT